MRPGYFFWPWRDSIPNPPDLTIEVVMARDKVRLKDFLRREELQLPLEPADDGDLAAHLKKLFNRYLKLVKSLRSTGMAGMIRGEHAVVKKLVDCIVKVVELHDRGEVIKAHTAFKKGMRDLRARGE